jgi:hypothetical protein
MSKKPSQPTDYARAIYTPHEVGMAGYEAAQFAQEHAASGIDLAIEGTELGEYFARALPWEIVAVQAQTSNGKSLFFDWWENKIAAQLVREKRKEVIIHVSTEETLEAMAFYQYAKILEIKAGDIARGNVDFDRMKYAMTVIDGIPIYRIADSAKREDGAPELTLSNIYRSIRALVNGEVTGEPVKPAAVFVDYLQALPLDPEVKSVNSDNPRRLQVRADVYRLREMATHLQCPVVIAVQAKQKMDGAKPPYMIPGMYDGEETSSIAQRFDRIISLWLPKTTYSVGENVNGIGIIEENMMFLKVNKQRGGFPAGKTFSLLVDYQHRTFVGAVTRTIRPNE